MKAIETYINELSESLKSEVKKSPYDRTVLCRKRYKDRDYGDAENECFTKCYKILRKKMNVDRKTLLSQIREKAWKILYRYLKVVRRVKSKDSQGGYRYIETPFTPESAKKAASNGIMFVGTQLNTNGSGKIFGEMNIPEIKYSGHGFVFTIYVEESGKYDIRNMGDSG